MTFDEAIDYLILQVGPGEILSDVREIVVVKSDFVGQDAVLNGVDRVRLFEEVVIGCESRLPSVGLGLRGKNVANSFADAGESAELPFYQSPTRQFSVRNSQTNYQYS